MNESACADSRWVLGHGGTQIAESRWGHDPVIGDHVSCGSQPTIAAVEDAMTHEQARSVSGVGVVHQVRAKLDALAIDFVETDSSCSDVPPVARHYENRGNDSGCESRSEEVRHRRPLSFEAMIYASRRVGVL